MDGRAIPLTRLAGYGMTNVPDAGGLFLRSQEYGTERDPDRTADAPVAQVQDGAISSHGHVTDPAGNHTHTVLEFFISSVELQDQENDNFGLNDYSGTVDFDSWFEFENDGSDYMRITRNSAVRATSTTGAHTHTIQNTGGPETRPTNMNFYIYIRVD